MTGSSSKLAVYLEIGKKRVFAAAVDWPGFCRSGRDEASALAALLDYGPRYAHVLAAGRLGFEAPPDIPALEVLERLPGNTTTDFGAPTMAPSRDSRPIDDASVQRLSTILQLCWQAFDDAAAAAEGKELRKGPRGGGRDLARMTEHVVRAEEAYLRQIGSPFRSASDADVTAKMRQVQQAVLEGLRAAAHGELPASGPRGGARWQPAYFVRRVAWHVLDHAWEIEDRVQ